MFKGLVAAMLLTTVGCGIRVDSSKMVEPPARSDEAIAAVADLYGLGGRPTVYWYGGAALGCLDPTKPWCDNGICWLSDNGLGCTAGEQEGDVILASDWGGDVPLSQMGIPAVLAHEMAHLKWGDPDHVGHAFADGGEADQATALLASLGM